jgi:hypothetical protein
MDFRRVPAGSGDHGVSLETATEQAVLPLDAAVGGVSGGDGATLRKRLRYQPSAIS